MKKIIGKLVGCVAMACMTAFGGLCSEEPGETGCQQWFKIGASGKISRGAGGGEYKAVQTLKVSDCWFVYSESNTVFHIEGKKGKTKFASDIPCTEFQWNVFGQKIAKLAEGETSKTVTCESEIAFVAEGDGVEVRGVLFGKVKGKATRASACDDVAEIQWTPTTFKGWFVGSADPDDCGCYYQMESELECRSTEVGCGPCGDTKEVSLRDCLNFVDSEPITHFGGTCTLKWSSKKSGCFER